MSVRLITEAVATTAPIFRDRTIAPAPPQAMSSIKPTAPSNSTYQAQKRAQRREIHTT